MTGTQSLLADYVRNGSERAFRELVTSFIDFVYSTAVRVVGGDRQLAEDVSQMVFVDLARKAAGLPEDVKLGGWLHRHTCFVAHKALRQEQRRKARERRAVELQLIADYTEDNLSQLASVLDEAINSLGAEDRRAILLRFFEQLDFQSVGEALGSSEDAARMRVARAVQKLGSRLKRQGITLSAAGLGFVLATKAVTAAPCGLAACVSNVSLASVVKGGSALALLKEACCTKLNAGLVGAALMVAFATLLITARHSDATGGAGVLEDLVAEADESPDAEMGVHTVSQSGVPALPVPAHDVPISVEESASTSPGENSPQVVPLRPKASIPAPTIALQPSPLPIATINPRANQFAEVVLPGRLRSGAIYRTGPSRQMVTNLVMLGTYRIPANTSQRTSTNASPTSLAQLSSTLKPGSEQQVAQVLYSEQAWGSVAGRLPPQRTTFIRGGNARPVNGNRSNRTTAGNGP